MTASFVIALESQQIEFGYIALVALESQGCVISSRGEDAFEVKIAHEQAKKIQEILSIGSQRGFWKPYEVLVNV